MNPQYTPPINVLNAVWNWLKDDQLSVDADSIRDERIDWKRCVPFVVMHLACLGVIWVGVSWFAVLVAAVLYVLCMFFVTGFYHRYFSHRTFRASRPVQFVMGVLACTAGQRGPIWWVAHHRCHHKHSDTEHDIHSPKIIGFFRSHMGWFMTKGAFGTDERLVRDWRKFPELCWLNRLDWIPLVVLAAGVYMLGAMLQAWAPGLGTTGPQLLVWGFFVSTIAVYHVTYTINSLAHQIGSQRYDTGDDSRNNFLLAIITLGEGWHNNHHHYPASARQGFFWWEIDLTYYGLCLMSALGLIRGLRPVPGRVLRRNRTDAPRDGVMP